jgi:hypothetical protein
MMRVIVPIILWETLALAHYATTSQPQLATVFLLNTTYNLIILADLDAKRSSHGW